MKSGQGRNRTGDTRLFRPLLYQLSYLSIYTKLLRTYLKSNPDSIGTFQAVALLRLGGNCLSIYTKLLRTYLKSNPDSIGTFQAVALLRLGGNCLSIYTKLLRTYLKSNPDSIGTFQAVALLRLGGSYLSLTFQAVALPNDCLSLLKFIKIMISQILIKPKTRLFSVCPGHYQFLSRESPSSATLCYESYIPEFTNKKYASIYSFLIYLLQLCLV